MGRVNLAGVSVSVALVLLAAALALFGGGGDSPDLAAAGQPRLVSPEELEALEAEAGHPIYWAGRRSATRLEATLEAGGAVYLRYLPASVGAGERPGAFLTVGSYPAPKALEATREAAAEAGAAVIHLPGGAVAFHDPHAHGSAYLAFPGSELQVEVYDPRPGKAMALIRGEAIRRVGD